MTQGLDADTILTSYAERLVSDGFTDVGRYLKNTSAEEIAALHAAGLRVWLIFERGATDALGGAAQGAVDGKVAFAQAQALGAPAGVAIYPAADADIQTSQAAVSEDYWAAFDGEIFPTYRIGAYADGTLDAALLTHGLNYPWLAGARGWSGFADFEANGNPCMIQGPQINAGETGHWNSLDWPALPFAYDPDVILSDNGAWAPPA